ncbi:hypothetical protein EDB80DRAFT_641179 [Ilyonectria destructans]|nr:hypothetical protein EDB80DRAFT_641179 [Ilyonectria destructans]
MHSDARDADPDTEEIAPRRASLDNILDASEDALETFVDSAGPGKTDITFGDSAGSEKLLSSPGPLSDEPNTGSFHCVTDHAEAGHILSARAGHIASHNGRRLLPRWKPGAVVTYSIAVESFPSKGYAKFAQRALVEAADDWNSRDVGVRFRLVNQGEPAVFALKYYRAPSRFFADSFFPDSKDRILYIFKFAFRREHRNYMANIFRHEIGHVLGLRHEEAETRESAVPSVALTRQNSLSIMSYFTDPSKIRIQESDIAAVRKLCAISEETFHGFVVITVDPDTLDQANFYDSDRLSSRGSDLESTRTGGSNRASIEEEPPHEETAEASLNEPTPTIGRNRAPRITVDFEPLGETQRPASHALEGEPAPVSTELLVPARAETTAPGFLAVPTRSECPPFTVFDEELTRPSSIGNDKERNLDSNTPQLDLQDALTPDPGTEDMFIVQDNPFAFSPGQLFKLFSPKNPSAFYALGGLRGLEIGLRTDRNTGLSLDETGLDGVITFEEAATNDIPKYGVLGDKAPEAVHGGGWVPAPPYTPPGRGGSGETNGSFADRKRIFRTNCLPKVKTKSIMKLARDVYCSEWLLIILTVAAVASSAWDMHQRVLASSHGSIAPNTEWTHGIAILVGVILAVSVETLYQWHTQRQIHRLDTKRSDRTANVVRSGRTIQIMVFDILVGDVVLISAGDIVPVDGILIDGHSIRCDESCCTGESDLIPKVPGDQAFTVLDDTMNGATSDHQVLTAMDPFILSGSTVLEGSGSFIVTAVGINSGYGRILMALREGHDISSYMRTLHDLSTYTIRRLGIGIAILLFTVCTIKFLATLPSSTLTPEEKGRNYLSMFVLTIALSVVSAPPFLSNVGSLTTAVLMARMTRDNNLARNSKACESAADITTICTSKTGVLTQGKMQVVAATVGNFRGFGNANLDFPTGTVDLTSDVNEHTTLMADISATCFTQSLNSEGRQLLIKSIAVNSTALEGEMYGEHTFIGSKIETALMVFGRDYLGLGPIEEERCNASIAQQLPFATRNGFMATIVRLPCGGFRVYVKGAPEILLGRCAKVVTITNPTDKTLSTVDLTDTDSELYQLRAASYGSRSLRPICLCYRDFSYWPSLDSFDMLCRDMILLAILGIQDSLRDGVVEAVRDCHHAGVVVRMVTGDHVETARAVAKEAGILTTGLILEGSAFRALDEQSQLEVLPRLAVLARATAEDKIILVRLLKILGDTVAVTGGSVGDCIAIKMAQVGFAKGISGTDAAVQAADIILMDDNFVSVTKCIYWGRAAKDSIAKFLQYKLAAIATAAVLTFFSAAALDASDSPVLNAAQLLWVGLMTDLAVLALLTNRPTETVRKRKPSPRAAPIITLSMKKMIVGQTICQLTITLVTFFGWFSMFGHKETSQAADDKTRRNTFVFNTFVWLQIFNIVNNQRLDNRFNVFEGTLRNRLFFCVGLLLAGGQVLIMFTGGKAFKLARLNSKEWAVSVAIGCMSLPCGVVLRLVPDHLIGLLTPEFMKRRYSPRVPQITIDLGGFNDDERRPASRGSGL